MKYRTIASKTLFWKGLSEPLLFSVFALLGLLNGWNYVVILPLVLIVISAGDHYLNHQNAYCRFEMSEYGLVNRYLILKWEDIHNYRLSRVFEIRRRKKLFGQQDLPSLVCFGESVEGDFRKQSPKKCIFFEMTPKNMKMLVKFAKGKSPVIDEFLERYYNIACQKARNHDT